MATTTDPNTLLKPFVLASVSAGAERSAVVEKTRASLEANGFTVVGTAEYARCDVLVVSNAAMQKHAARSNHGAYGAVLRVAVTTTKSTEDEAAAAEEVQVSYTNPLYWSQCFRMEENMQAEADALRSALCGEGAETQGFGSSKGKKVSTLRKYHYKLGMPYFDEVLQLHKCKDHAEALRRVEAGLQAQVSGTKQVYRVDLPDKQESVFGVQMSACADNPEYSDQAIMDEIDMSPLKHSAHLPYELVVTNGVVHTLSPKFRIAISFPGLSMVGAHSFGAIMGCPSAIEKTLKKAVRHE
jgi:hypothetical protein